MAPGSRRCGGRSGVRARGDAGRAGGVVIAADAARDVRRAHVPDLHGHHGEPRAQQHPGEPAGPRGRHALQRPGDRGQPGHRGARSSRTARRCRTGASRWARGYRSRARSPGPWGALSVVTGPFAGDDRHDAERPAARPQRRRHGRDARGRRRRCADRRRRPRCAAKASSLWAQGGTPTDPGARPAVPGQFGFGALRCAVDVLNGDNVEWIAYPAGAKHVFCYAYYVVAAADERDDRRQQGRRRPGGHRHAVVRLPGRHLLHPGETFAIAASAGKPGSATFYRAAGQTWSWRELDLPGWIEGRPVLPLGDRREPDPDRRRHRRGLGRSRGGGHGDVHPHQPARAAAGRPAALQAHARRDRELRLRRVRARQRHPDDRDDRPGDAGRGRAADADAGDVRRRRAAAGRRRRPGAGRSRASPATASGRTTAADRSRSCPGRARRVSSPTCSRPAARSRCASAPRAPPARRTSSSGRSRSRRVSFEQRAETSGSGDTALATGTTRRRSRWAATRSSRSGPAARAGGHWTLESVLCDGVPVGNAQGRTS